MCRVSVLVAGSGMHASLQYEACMLCQLYHISHGMSSTLHVTRPRFKALRRKLVHTLAKNPRSKGRHETVDVKLYTKKTSSKYVDFGQDREGGWLIRACAFNFSCSRFLCLSHFKRFKYNQLISYVNTSTSKRTGHDSQDQVFRR